MLNIATLKSLNSEIPILLAPEFARQYREECRALGFGPHADAILDAKNRRLTAETVRAIYNSIALGIRAALDTAIKATTIKANVAVKTANPNDVARQLAASVNVTKLPAMNGDVDTAGSEKRKIRKATGIPLPGASKLAQKKAETTDAAVDERAKIVAANRARAEALVHVSIPATLDKGAAKVERERFFRDFRHIGGKDALTASDMMDRYAALIGGDPRLASTYRAYRLNQVSATYAVNYARTVLFEEQRSPRRGYVMPRPSLEVRDTGKIVDFPSRPTPYERSIAQEKSREMYEYYRAHGLANYEFQEHYDGSPEELAALDYQAKINAAAARGKLPSVPKAESSPKGKKASRAKERKLDGLSAREVPFDPKNVAAFLDALINMGRGSVEA